MALETVPRPRLRIAPHPELQRKDAWWIQPVISAIVLIGFGLYSTLRVFENRYMDTYAQGPHYLSPFYALPTPGWDVFRLPIVAATWALLFPVSFRASCYFCRRTAYRALLWDPPACAVREIAARRSYSGERKFPFNMVNLHRYTLYAILVLVAFHWKHLLDAFFITSGGATHFGVGLGTLLLLLDTLLLSAYVFSCHSFRHLIGGAMNVFSRSRTGQARHALWQGVSWMNARHGLFFWLSLLSIGAADLYIRLVAAHTITDFRLF